MSVADPTAWATAMNNLGIVPMGLTGQHLLSDSVCLPGFDPGLGIMTGITPINPMMAGISLVPPPPVPLELPIIKEIIHCKSCTLFPQNPGCKTVFVGGLPENATEEIIREVFDQCGEITAIRKSKKNFCHIRFTEEFMVDKAIYLSDLPPPSTRERPPGCKTVFVGGLPENATEEIIREVFDQCGEITAIRKSKKNFCHIRFTEEFMVDKAIYLSDDSKFTEAIAVLVTWIDRGEVNRRSANHFYSMVQSANSHVRRLMNEKAMHEEEMELAKDRFRDSLSGILTQYDSKFTEAIAVLVTWIDRGEVNRRSANHFYSMVQSANSHVRRLMNEKGMHEEEMELAKDRFRDSLSGILTQFEQIVAVFAAATRQRAWDHFSKAQRKNIDIWRKQCEELRNAHSEELMGIRREEEMEMSEDESEENPNKKIKINDSALAAQAYALKEENDSLRWQLDAYRNEVELLKQEQGKACRTEEDHTKEHQLHFLQQTMQGMQQQLVELQGDLQRKESELEHAREEQRCMEVQLIALKEKLFCIHCDPFSIPAGFSSKYLIISLMEAQYRLLLMQTSTQQPDLLPRHYGYENTRQQAQPPEQLFYKDWPLAKLLKTLHDNNINIPAGSERIALFNNNCTFISATPMLPPSCKRASANSFAQSPSTGAAAPLPVMVVASSPAQQRSNQTHLNSSSFSFITTFSRMKSLIHPIAISIASINTAQHMDKRVASKTAAISITLSPVFTTSIMAAVFSVEALQCGESQLIFIYVVSVEALQCGESQLIFIYVVSAKALQCGESQLIFIYVVSAKALQCGESQLIFIYVVSAKVVQCEESQLIFIYVVSAKALQSGESQLIFIYVVSAKALQCGESQLIFIYVVSVEALQCGESQLIFIYVVSAKALQSGESQLIFIYVVSAKALQSGESQLIFIYVVSAKALQCGESQLIFIYVVSAKALQCGESQLIFIYVVSAKALQCGESQLIFIYVVSAKALQCGESQLIFIYVVSAKALQCGESQLIFIYVVSAKALQCGESQLIFIYVVSAKALQCGESQLIFIYVVSAKALQCGESQLIFIYVVSAKALQCGESQLIFIYVVSAKALQCGESQLIFIYVVSVEALQCGESQLIFIYVVSAEALQSGESQLIFIYVVSAKALQCGESQLIFIYVVSAKALQSGESQLIFIYVVSAKALQSGESQLIFIYVVSAKALQSGKSQLIFIYVVSAKALQSGKSLRAEEMYGCKEETKSNLSVSKKAKVWIKEYPIGEPLFNVLFILHETP
ncbi:UNVERIFIED_CONTAM: hypothetical protein FKN15_061550 [Acipenser sinensis]